MSSSIYHYDPTLAGAIIALIFYGASTVFHIFQLWKFKCYFFTTFIIGAIMMTVGYLFRAASSQNQTSLGLYIGQSICLLLPPSLYAATIYMIYGRIVVYAQSPELSIIAPGKVTKIFVLGDVFAFFLQASGGGMMAMESMAKMGQNIAIVGLFIQLIFFGFFFAVSVVFCRRVETTKRVKIVHLPYGALLYVLFLVSALIIIRCLYRIVEFVQGSDGYLMKHEAYLYVFDTVPMFVVQAIFHRFHPANALPQKGSFAGVETELR
ncbi:RTA1 like protein-domain-containing protein [Aspergillus pseudodeflectus]|uniref:RTA1 like protein-domain-containing protein n=1 Tax=Aspergillus pseudodeflectus TaxID=176178 RepID=A0ABR4KBA8_9EURO